MRLSTKSLLQACQIAAFGCVYFGHLMQAIKPGDAPIFAEFRSANQIREEIQNLRDRVEAIRMDCTTQSRDMTDEEQTEVDSILGSGEGAEAKQGKITRLEAALARAERVEANQASIVLARANSQPSPEATLEPSNRIIVPSQFLTGKPLQAFSGPTAMADAYSAGRFYLAALYNHAPSVEFCRSHGIQLVQAAQTGGVDGKGGFLVPSELSATIIRYAYQYGRVLEYADVRTMSTDTLDVTKEVGDPAAQWMGANGVASERAAVPELDFDYANYKLVANKLGALTRLSSEITVDAIIEMADNITVRLARAAAKQFDQTGFLGTGNAASGGFTGILPALLAGSVFQAPNGILQYSQFTKAHFDAIVGRVEEYADDDRCAWFVNKRFYTLAMAPIKEAMGGNNGMDIADGTARRKLFFLGYPVVFCSIFPKTQGAIPVNTWLGGFGDLYASLLAGIRKDVQIAVSTEAAFTTDEILMRLLMRGAVITHDVGTATEGGAFIGIKNGAA